MNRAVILASIILVFASNFQTTHCDVRDNLAGPDYEGIGLSNLAIALSLGWCVYFGACLFGLIATPHRRAAAGLRFRASLEAGRMKLFPYARLYIIALPLCFGFRCAWWSETGQRYTTLSFGPVAAITPMILTMAAVTLLNFYMAAISRTDCERPKTQAA